MNFDLSSMGLCLGRGKSTRRCCTVFAYTGDTKNLAICNIYHCNHFLRLLARSIITSIIFVCNVACDLYKWLPATFDNRKQISNSLNYSTVCDELCMSRYIIFFTETLCLKMQAFWFLSRIRRYLYEVTKQTTFLGVNNVQCNFPENFARFSPLFSDKKKRIQLWKALSLGSKTDVSSPI